MSPLIELRNLTKDYGKFRALSAVSLTIEDGITGLLGPNGAGKSTLIKVLLGLVRITSGEGHVLGHNVTTESAAVRAKVGYMPEDDCYMHGLSGIESVQVAARLSCLPRTESLRRGHEILDFCGMGQERYRKVETYSTGMRQKLRFAMAIVHDPELLILDEPTSGLDPEEREAMLNRISILSKKFGKSVILCTHILPDVKVVCDSVAILAAGQVRLSAPLNELLKSPHPAVNVDLSGDGQALSDALRADGLDAEVQADGTLRVSGQAADVSGQLWHYAQDCGAAVQNMISSQSSLEEVFLKAVGEKRDADS
ncbi:MAG: ABC transporter ATP-binding protein [Fuerstiella sp.]|nr:ABC transporter ATP-binding protein [Fuerstiella sp.]MCP4857824.1 ABC transporter ATP-binding protein [Fuerstiella sp.]